MFLKDVANWTKPAGSAAETIERLKQAGEVPELFHLLAAKPAMASALGDFAEAIMRGPSPLSPGMRELIAAFTSAGNYCEFSTDAHAAAAAELLGDRTMVDAVLEDYRSAPIPESDQALFAFIEKVNADTHTVDQDDVDTLYEYGWSDEAILDAVLVCGLFNFYNVLVDATGVAPMSNKGYTTAGRRLARNGYRDG